MVEIREDETYPKPTCIVVIKPPSRSDTAVLDLFAVQLRKLGMWPVIQTEGTDTWFPTDEFRTVGDWIFLPEYGHVDLCLMEEVLMHVISANNSQPNSFLYRLQPGSTTTRQFTIMQYQELWPGYNVTYFPIAGGHYIYSSKFKLLICGWGLGNTAKLVAKPKLIGQVDQALTSLHENGWRIEYADALNSSLTPGGRREDLDFLMSLYDGRDGEPHVLVAESFERQVPGCIKQANIHVVSTQEAIAGGCNIADVGNGRYLLAPPKGVAPSVFRVLQETAAAIVIETPIDFHSNGGATRCSISWLPFPHSTISQ
ncbi:MAG: hypothetical protein PHS44_05260 [Candidatus Dojkabacteria bacterium]|nr:hypothetical protein [Candidatus Dojkabacteria bacterium]